MIRKLLTKLLTPMADTKNNTGMENTGYRNSGDRNSGYRNSGDWNSGYRNSGDWNSGDWNSGDRNSGWFNTDEPKLRLFNRDSEYTLSELVKKFGFSPVDLPINTWVEASDMTEDEKKAAKDWETAGGYLKTLSYKEAWKVGWAEATEEQRQWHLSLPNFDAKIFEEITGIDVTEKRIVEKSVSELEAELKLPSGSLRIRKDGDAPPAQQSR